MSMPATPKVTMTPHDAFLRDIIANPDDDTPRLIYADWLEDQSDPRGEFIHVQCLLADLAVEDPRRPALQARERELLARHQDQWLGPLRPLLSGWTFRRGFLDAVSVPAATYLAHADIPRPATVRSLEVDLTGFEVSRPVIEFIPESVARENIVLPIGFRGRTVVLAVPDPRDIDTVQKLQFILNRDVEPVAAPAGQRVEAINRHYGQSEFESVSTACFIEPDIDLWQDPADAGTPVARLVELILAEASALSADIDQVRIEPEPDRLRVLYRLGREWAERDTPPRRLLEPIVARIRLLAGIASDPGECEQRGSTRGTAHGRPFDVEVVIRRTDDGPLVVLTLLPPGTAGEHQAT
jgi:uncharacterized protein (TIGR02996 family)